MTELLDIERLQTKSILHEVVFHSRIPVIGALIARFRTVWNSISTKWYVLPLVHQQTEFNVLAVAQLRAISEQLQHQEARLAEIDRQLIIQRADWKEMLEVRIRDLESRLIAQDREQSEIIHDLAELRLQLVQLRKQVGQIGQPAMPGVETYGGTRSE